MSYLSQLSRNQRVWLVATMIGIIAILAGGWVLESKVADVKVPTFSTDRSIREIAPRLGATGFAIAKELHLLRKVDKDKPLRELGVSQERLDHVTAHLVSHRGRPLKYFVFAALVLFGLVFLTRLGRPDGCPSSERTTWYPRAPYIVALLVAVVVCGFLLGKSPNPMEGAVKVFKSMVGLYPSIGAKVLAFLFFVGLAIVGNKLICGWACPFGALQELFYSLPILKRIKRHKLPFVVSNSIRAGLFVVMLLLLFGVVGGRRGFVLYHGINPFNLFTFEFDSWTILATVFASLGLGLAIYRPYCQLICPFGFVSWLAERLSLIRVRVNHDQCDRCDACGNACPTGAARQIVHGKAFPADCYSCARCLNVCHSDAITYGLAIVRLQNTKHAESVTPNAPS